MAGFYNSGKNSLLENEELQEEDVWAVMKGRGKIGKERPSPSSASACRIFPTTPRVIPRVKSGSFESYQGVVHHQTSAPVNMPDWSKIHRKKSNSSNDNHDRAEPFGAFHGNVNADDADDADEEDDSEEMLPPHEFIARRLARSPIASFSMCEGIGRTLKGRDLSRLRNAILTKTGFLE